MNDFYLIADPTAFTARMSPLYEHHWPTTGWLRFISSWAGSWHRLWTFPICLLLTKSCVSGSRSDCERLMICSWDDSWIRMCTYPTCFTCELCAYDYWLPFDMITDTAYTWPHSDYYRRTDCDIYIYIYMIRSWDERWHCLCDCSYWLLFTSDLWVTSDYYLSWQLTLLVCTHVLIATDRLFALRGVDKYAVSGAWACCAFTCGEGAASLISCPLLNCCEHMERSYLTDDSMLNRLVDVIRDWWVFKFALGKRSSGRHDR